MRPEYLLLDNAHIGHARKRLNTDAALKCHKCDVPLKFGDLVHFQRHFVYCQSCWSQAYLETEDEIE
jgi:hypothetical protein